MHSGAVTGGASGAHVWLNCAMLGTGITARLSPDEADALADRLHEWARQVRQTGPR